MSLAAVGVTVGVGAALGLTRFMSSMLFEVSPSDVATFASVVAGLVITSLLACVVPARRAAGLDPAITLREE